ncbi:hypothetical protein [Paracoccus siganidrum]|nr:hypothetical protein [Paracoccus siganidrum]
MVLAATGAPALAEGVDPCAGIDTNLTDKRAREYAHLIVDAFSKDLKPSERFKPSDVEVESFLGGGHWSAVNASIPTADMAMFFFQEVGGKKQFKDVWGGIAEASEAPQLIEWAEDLGAPHNFATCFADQVTFDDNAGSPFGFTVDLTFSAKAEERLAALHEEVIVSASYYGEPSAKGKEFADDVGRFDLGTETVQVPASPGIAKITGDQVGESDLEWIEGRPNVNVNVFTARISGDDNFISCDFIDGPVDDVIQSMPVALHCTLIEEEVDAEPKP